MKYQARQTNIGLSAAGGSIAREKISKINLNHVKHAGMGARERGLIYSELLIQ